MNNSLYKKPFVTQAKTLFEQARDDGALGEKTVKHFDSLIKMLDT